MLPKIGKVLHKSGNGAGGGGPEAAYARLISDALVRELGGSHQAIKRLMRWTGASERTAKNWLSGACGPSGANLMRIMAHSDEVLDCVLNSAGKRTALCADRIGFARLKLAAVLRELDEIIDQQSS